MLGETRHPSLHVLTEGVVTLLNCTTVCVFMDDTITLSMQQPTRRQVLFTCSAGVSTLLAGCTDTQSGGDKPAPLSVVNSSVGSFPANTRFQQGTVLFDERPSENAVVVGVIVRTTGCEQPRHSITEDVSGSDVKLNITADRPDSLGDNIACTTVIRPQRYAVRLEFNSLQVGGVISVAVDAMGRVEYEISGEDGVSEKILRIPEIDGEVQPSNDT